MSNRLEILRDRASQLGTVRRFFEQRNVIEVDCPMLGRSAAVDLHIDLIPCTYAHKDICYLQSSPEYGMKRLLAEGIGDCYQLSHVFRDGENGSLHSPEFMMVEWYRCEIDYTSFIDETLELIRLFLPELPSNQITYREAFHKYCGIDPFKANVVDLLNCLESHQISAYDGLEDEGRDAILNQLLANCIEPNLGNDALTVLSEYPASQAALARTKTMDGNEVAYRYEIYFRGVELCNGYYELTDPVEQRSRFEQANQERIRHGKQPLPIDEDFLASLELGLPNCCGVAVGFDRLMMLRHNVKHIHQVLPQTVV